MIIYQNQLFTLIPKSISNFPKLLRTWKWKDFSQNRPFLFLFALTLDTFKAVDDKIRNSALVLNQSDIINKWKKLALRNRNLRKKKECILLFIITSWLEQMANKNLRDRMQILVSHGFLKEADFVSWKRTWEEGHFYRTTHYRRVLNNENSSKHAEVNFRKIYRKTSVLE